jgi:ferric-dicitrate binding protein FerR (iron transport regulator)
VAALALFPALSRGQDFGGAAKVLVITGRVSVIRDGVEWARNVGDVIQPKQLIVTGPNSYAKLELADGSTFEVFENTRTVFRETPGWTDLLNVLIGRVKVYIQHRNGPNPNQVTTQTAVISVRGTIFDVVVEDEDGTTFVSVDEGIVDVRHLRFGGRGIDVHAGESLRVFRDQPLARAADKGNAVRMALRAAAQAVYDEMSRRGVGGGGTSGSSAPSGGTSTSTGTAQGDKGKNTSGGTAPQPPPPAPPPPPPAPPQ